MRKNETTFICCVESGYLEDQVIRLIKSIRMFGGGFSNFDIIAVTSRIGPPLKKTTRNFFKENNVLYLRKTYDRYRWFNFLNKPLACCFAKEFIKTECVTFIDSDMIMTGEPEQILLKENEDFLAFPIETKEQGTESMDDDFAGIWTKFCDELNIELKSLPLVETEETKRKIRFYFNSGIFTYRNDSDFAKMYLDITLKFLDSYYIVDHPGYSDGLKEQSAIGFAAYTMGLRWRFLPYSYNYVMSSDTHNNWYKKENLEKAIIVHYHDSMWAPFWDIFLECIQDTHIDVYKWLKSEGAMSNKASIFNKAITKILKYIWKKEMEKYHKKCISV